MKFKRLKQINRILSKEEKIDVAKLALMLMLMGVFDVLGIASIMPFMSVVSDPSLVESNLIIKKIYNYLEFQNHKSFVMLFGLGVIALIIISNSFKLVTIYTMTTYWIS